MYFIILLLVQFNAVENGITMSKLTQVFSKQAPMMDALISHFADLMRRRRDGTNNQAGENLIEGKPERSKNKRSSHILAISH